MTSLLPKSYRDAIQTYWSARTERERRFILIWAAALGTLILIFGIALPLNQKIAQLEKRIPPLEKQLLLMRAQTQNTPAKPATSIADLRSTLFEILARDKIHADIRALTNGRIELRLPAMHFQDGLSLANNLRQETRAQILALQITANAPAQPAQLVLEMGRD